MGWSWCCSISGWIGCEGMLTEVFRYWSRWITARRLTHTRRVDPDWVERHELFASIAGINLQLDTL